VKNKQLLTEIENINRLIGYDRSKPVLEQSEDDKPVISVTLGAAEVVGNQKNRINIGGSVGEKLGITYDPKKIKSISNLTVGGEPLQTIYFCPEVSCGKNTFPLNQTNDKLQKFIKQITQKACKGGYTGAGGRVGYWVDVQNYLLDKVSQFEKNNQSKTKIYKQLAATVGAYGGPIPNVCQDMVQLPNLDEILERGYEWFIKEGNYHILIDILSFIAYTLCGPTAGIGCAVSFALSLLNAFTYALEGDYYFMGLELFTLIIPGGDVIKYSLKPTSKLFNTIIGEVIQKGALSASEIKNIVKKFGTKEVKDLIKKHLTPHLGKFKNSLNKIEESIKMLQGYVKEYPKFKKVVDYIISILNKIRGAIKALIVTFGEILVYDPKLIGGLFGWIDMKIRGSDELSDYSLTLIQYLDKYPKIGVEILMKICGEMDSCKCLENLIENKYQIQLSSGDVTLEDIKKEFEETIGKPLQCEDIIEKLPNYDVQIDDVTNSITVEPINLTESDTKNLFIEFILDQYPEINKNDLHELTLEELYKKYPEIHEEE